MGRIEIDRVVPDPAQPRTEFAEEDIERLAASLRSSGQLAPIRVCWAEPQGSWMIVAGERRWRAAKLAGLATIECVFHETDLSPGETLELQMVENLLRSDLKPMEEARGYQRLMELRGYTGQQVAAALSVPASKVSRTLALLRLPEDVQVRVDAGELASRTAYELTKLDDPDRIRRLADQAAAERLTHADIAKKVRQRRGKSRKTAHGTRQVFLTEEGWKVTVSSTRKGTYHEIQQALEIVLSEVRHRVANNVQLF
jgi:ParB family chromosome partitioning protein